MYRTIIEPRVSETDGLGHINNTTIPVWLEAGRTKLFRLFMPDLSFSNWKLILVNTNVNFIAQIYYGIDIEVHTYVEKIGNTSFTLYEEVHQGEKLCVKASNTYVNFNFKLQKPEPIPKGIRSQLENHFRET